MLMFELGELTLRARGDVHCSDLYVGQSQFQYQGSQLLALHCSVPANDRKMLQTTRGLHRDVIEYGLQNCTHLDG